MNLAENLKKIRKDNNLSQEQLAEKLGVSRQSVSKWESNQAYPEMDKVLQICQLFNLNIDDLLNQDIKEVNNIKQSKNNINKFIDDLLDFITKAIDMFSSMKFKEKVKCLFEQIFIGSILSIILIVIGVIGRSLIQNIIMILPENIYFIILNIIESIYFCICFVLIVALLLYIFKVRYLDYYIFIKNEVVDSNIIVETDEELYEEKINPKIILEKKKEKIVIRDPKHTGYKFITFLLKSFLFFLKLLALLLGLGFCISFICLFIVLAISFVFVKTGLMFLGLLLSVISCIIINLIILIIIYNFVISQKIRKSKLGLLFVISLILLGLGIGFIFIGITSFNYIDNINSKYYIEDEFYVEMKDDLIIHDYYYEVDYIESGNNDLKVVYKHSNTFDIILEEDSENEIYFYSILKDSNIMNFIRQIIDDINNKKIINYSNFKIYVYTSKENINKLLDNKKNYLLREDDDLLEEKNNRIEELETLLNNCESNY